MVIELLRQFAQRIRFGKPEPVPQWRTPAILDRGVLGGACLALNGRGRGSVLWDNQGEIWTMPIGPGTSPALVRLPLGEGTSPQIVLNHEGRGIALWQAEVAGVRHIMGMVLGGGESMAHVIFKTEGRIQHLQAAVDRRGNALVVWLLETKGHSEVIAHAFDTRGLAWALEPTILGIPSSPAVEPRIAVNHREHAMVLWEVQDPSFQGLVASHYWPSDRIWSDRPMPVVSHATSHHQVVMDDLGNALALWIHAPLGQQSTLEASFYDGCLFEWGEPEIVDNATSFSNPRLVMSGNGEALAAWCQLDGEGDTSLFVKTFRLGKWEADAYCLDLGPGEIRDFAIDLSEDGQAGLIAVQRGPEGDWVSAQLRKGDWSAPVQLVPPSAVPRSSPRIAICPQGASVLWLHGEGHKQSLFLTETH